jgi:hypothetical protein
LKHVLREMYSTVQQRVIGGFIELEAFEGNIGYRVVLSPEGEFRVLKGAQGTDVSSDPNDPITVEALSIIRQTENAHVEPDGEEENEEEEQEEQSHQRSDSVENKQQVWG